MKRPHHPGFYSTRSRGERAKKAPRAEAPTTTASDRAPAFVRKAWAAMIRRAYETDPLLCECGARLRVIAFLDDLAIVQRILRHVGLLDDGLDEPNGRAPPEAAAAEIVVEPILDDLAPDYDSVD